MGVALRIFKHFSASRFIPLLIFRWRIRLGIDYAVIFSLTIESLLQLCRAGFTAFLRFSKDESGIHPQFDHVWSRGESEIYTPQIFKIAFWPRVAKRRV